MQDEGGDECQVGNVQWPEEGVAVLGLDQHDANVPEQEPKRPHR